MKNQESKINVGDIAYHVSGANPNPNEVFDRFGVYQIIIDSIKRDKSGKVIQYLEKEINELRRASNPDRVHLSLDAAKAQAKRLMEESDDKYQIHKDDPILFIPLQQADKDIDIESEQHLEEIENQFHHIKTKNKTEYTYLFKGLNSTEIINLATLTIDQIKTIVIQYLWTPETSSIIEGTKTILYYADEELSAEIKDINQLKKYYEAYEGYFEDTATQILLDIYNEKIEILYVR